MIRRMVAARQQRALNNKVQDNTTHTQYVERPIQMREREYSLDLTALYKLSDVIYLQHNNLVGSNNYNAAIIDTASGTRIFYRATTFQKIKYDSQYFESFICSAHIDLSSLHITDSSHILVKNNLAASPYFETTPYSCFQAEDPRVIKYNDHYFVLYTDGFNMYCAKITETMSVVYYHQLAKPAGIVYTRSDGREKNWIPFVHNDNIYILYSASPFIYFKCNDTGSNLIVESVERVDTTLEYKYGDIRGGCPPVFISYNDKIYMLWLFHSLITTNNTRFYNIGGYLTDGLIPVAISKKPVLLDAIVFPCGAISNEDTITVSMGVNDNYIGLLKIDKMKLLTDMSWL